MIRFSLIFVIPNCNAIPDSFHPNFPSFCNPLVSAIYLSDFPQYDCRFTEPDMSFSKLSLHNFSLSDWLEGWRIAVSSASLSDLQEMLWGDNSDDVEENRSIGVEIDKVGVVTSLCWLRLLSGSVHWRRYVAKLGSEAVAMEKKEKMPMVAHSSCVTRVRDFEEGWDWEGGKKVVRKVGWREARRWRWYNFTRDEWWLARSCGGDWKNPGQR